MKKKNFYNNKLTKISKPIKKYIIYGFDIETHGYKNKITIGGIYDHRYHCFLKKEELIKYIKDIKEKNLYIAATNLNFDFFGAFYEAKLMDGFKPITRNGTMILGKLYDKKFIDTRNYAGASVKELGKLVNLEKKYSKFAKNASIPKTMNDWRKYKEYNARDCLISKKFVEYLQDVCSNILGCELKMTIGSSAMDLYRRKYMPFTIYKEKDYDKIKTMIYKAYYGGRTEAFERGIKRMKKNKYIHYYDINSLYPSVMLNKYPLPASERYIESDIGLLPSRYINDYEGISEVEIYSPKKNNYPLLPHRLNERDDDFMTTKGYIPKKLLFPTGTFKGYYTHIELRKAIKEGYTILNIFKTIYYTKTFYPFKKYAAKLYDIRLKYQKEGNKPMEKIIKLFMNSLYGKFATKSNQEIEFKDFNEHDIEEAEGYYIDLKTFLGYKTTENDAENNYVIPILSVYTTAYARLKMYDYIKISEPIYTDTDSLMTLKTLPTSDRLGELKLEKEIKEVEVIKPKWYHIRIEKDGKMNDPKIKGFHNMTKTMNTRLINGKSVKQKHFMKPLEAIRQKRSVNERVMNIKSANTDDDKRDWDNKSYDRNNWQKSKPIHLS